MQDLLMYFWVAVIIVFALIEMMTITFYSVCFSIGAIFALIMYTLGFDIVGQLSAFIIVLIICLFLIVPLMRRLLNIKVNDNRQGIPTNLDLIIGEDGVCLERISLHQNGLVKVAGKEWTARVNEDVIIEPHDIVIVEKIIGSKIIVKKKEEDFR
ncbi:MAG: NfeD family protein [Bacilli bacterium]|jgi:membrane protein implicated in regulation of membrane protease activity|nr:NfeD family protein [Bacilli bacterium]